MPQPLVSICIPVFNGARYLREALQSALDQSYDNLEVLVVDNGSSDATPAILAEFASAPGGRLRLFRNEQTVPMAENFNIAVSRARGDYLKILPHDDVLTPNSVERLMIEQRPGDGLIVGLRKFIFDDAPLGRRFFYGNLNRFWRVDRRLGSGSVSPERYAQRAAANTTHNIVGEPANVLIARAAFHAAGGFSPPFHQLCDLRLWHAVAMREGMRVVPETVAYFRVHGESESSAGRRKKNIALLREHYELSLFVLQALAECGARTLIDDASANLALDAARLSAAIKGSEETMEEVTIVTTEFDDLAERVRSAIPAKRVYQLLALRAARALSGR